MQPTLLLDFDGVVNLDFRGNSPEDPNLLWLYYDCRRDVVTSDVEVIGFTTREDFLNYRIFKDNYKATGAYDETSPYYNRIVIPLILEKGMLTRLQQLQENFEIMWCTSWNEAANEWFNQRFNISDFEILHLGHKDALYNDGLSWKTHKIIESMGDEHFIWVDDNVGDLDMEFIKRTHSSSTVIRTDSTTGLTDAVVNKIHKFAESVS